MRKINIVTLLVISSLAIIGVSFAADEAQKTDAGAAAVPAEAKNVKAMDMAPREMAADIADTLDKTAEIINFIPGLKKEIDPSGKAFYTFQGVKIGDLDKEKIKMLYNRVHQERTRINTERINRQLESVRRSQQLRNIAQNAAAARSISASPSTPRVPPAPPPSVSVPQVPRVPVQPAQPKR